MALRVSGDPDPAHPVRPAADQWQQLSGRGELPRRLAVVPADHEHLVDPGLAHPLQELLQVGLVPDRPRRQVRRRMVAELGQPHRELDRALRAVPRRARDRQLGRLRQLLRLLLGPREGENLELGRSDGLIH